MLRGEFKIVNREQIWQTPTYLKFVYGDPGTFALSFSIGNGRADGFRFRSEPPARELDPYYEFGGLAAITEVRPGQSGELEILLNRYLQFLRPGPYLVHCELDLDVLHGGTHERSHEQFRSDVSFTLHDDPKRRHAELAALEADLQHPGPRQMRAATALSELRSPEVLPILERGLRSPSSAVVERMLIGLGNTGGEEARKLLREFVDSPASPVLIRIAKQELEK